MVLGSATERKKYTSLHLHSRGTSRWNHRDHHDPDSDWAAARRPEGDLADADVVHSEE